MANFKFRKVNIKPEISMSPLIDMVFLLLIFFVVTSTFKKDTGLKINKPKAKNVMEIDINLQENILGISKDNTITFNKQKISLDNLDEIIGNLKNKKDSTVTIISDTEADVGILIKTIDVMNTYNYENFIIAAERDRD